MSDSSRNSTHGLKVAKSVMAPWHCNSGSGSDVCLGVGAEGCRVHGVGLGVMAQGSAFARLTTNSERPD